MNSLEITDCTRFTPVVIPFADQGIEQFVDSGARDVTEGNDAPGGNQVPLRLPDVVLPGLSSSPLANVS